MSADIFDVGLKNLSNYKLMQRYYKDYLNKARIKHWSKKLKNPNKNIVIITKLFKKINDLLTKFIKSDKSRCQTFFKAFLLDLDWGLMSLSRLLLRNMLTVSDAEGDPPNTKSSHESFLFMYTRPF